MVREGRQRARALRQLFQARQHRQGTRRALQPSRSVARRQVDEDIAIRGVAFEVALQRRPVDRPFSTEPFFTGALVCAGVWLAKLTTSTHASPISLTSNVARMLLENHDLAKKAQTGAARLEPIISMTAELTIGEITHEYF